MREIIRLILVSVVYYFIDPILALFVVVAGCLVSIYTLKSFIFISTGHFSITHPQLPDELAPSTMEAVFGIMLALIVCAAKLLTQYYLRKGSHRLPEEFPLHEMLPRLHASELYTGGNYPDTNEEEEEDE